MKAEPGSPLRTGVLQRQTGTALDPALSAEMSRSFDADLSGVRVHTGPDAAASATALRAAAYTVGDHIVFGEARFAPHTTEGRRLLAHELSHVVQQRTASGPARVSRASDSAEVEADHAAHTVLAGRRPRITAGGPAIARQEVPAVDPFAPLLSGSTLTPVEASGLLDAYEALDPADRDAFVRKHHGIAVTSSGVTRLLAALSPAERKTRRGLLSDVLERVQRIAAETTAGKTLVELGAVQGAFMKPEAERLARAKKAADAKKAGVPTPAPVTDADIEAALDAETKRTSRVKATVTNAWDAVAAVPGAQAKWNARAAKVITSVVDACNKKDPTLGITAANLKWAPREVAQKAANAFASSGDPISFGMSFVETAEDSPESVVRVVVHEIAGHPEFGSRFRSFEAQVYVEALKQEPSLGSPWDTEERVNTFGYFGTEIYAALREVPYEVAVTASAVEKGLSGAIEPAKNIDDSIGLVKIKYAPGVAEAIVQGLYERFRVDPRVSDDALALFERTVARHFPKVLKGVPKRGPDWVFELSPGVGLEQQGGRTLAFTTVELRIAARWANSAAGAGLRLEMPLDGKDQFLRLGLQGGLQQRLFSELYGELRAGYAWGIAGGASSGLTVGAGVSYDFGPAQLGLVYDFLKAADDKDPDAHRTFLRLGLRF